MDGQLRDVDEAYTTPEGLELAYPRDPTAPPGETVNCGCQSLPYMASWEQAGAPRHPGARPAEEAAPAVVSDAGSGRRWWMWTRTVPWWCARRIRSQSIASRLTSPLAVRVTSGFR